MDQHNSPGTTQSVHTKPVDTAERIKSIDTIRGVALLGILMMNIPLFGIDQSVWFSLIGGPRSGNDYYTFGVVFVFFEGTMRGLFSMLFGAGMVLFMFNKKDVPGEPPVATYYYRRLLWLVVFGLINAFVILWQGDILFFYGLAGMLLFAFRKLQPKWLLMIALLVVSFGIIKKQWSWNETKERRENYNEAIAAREAKKELTPEQQGAIAGWEEREKNNKPDSAEYKKNDKKMHSGYGTIFSYFIPINSTGEVFYMYHDPWDLLSMMFLGMALFRWGFFSNRLKTSTYGMWMLIGYGLGIPIAWQLFNNGWMSFGELGAGGFADRWSSSPQVFVEFRRILLTIGHASLVMLIFRSRIVPWLMKLLANVGQMAFTNYLMQSIICTFFFFGYGFDNYNKLRFHQLYYVVFSVWIFQLIFSAIWLRYFRFGPFEWLWRSLTYWKRQPMKK